VLGLSGSTLGATLDASKLPPAAKTNIDFGRDIQPIFEKTCLRCHGPERPKSQFRLDNRESALKGGENGVDIIPGDSAKSSLVYNVARLVEGLEMPPPGKGDPLTPEQVGLLRAWIDQGAAFSTNNPAAQFGFSAAPTLRWIGVSGNKAKFREVEGLKEGLVSGLEHFSLQEQISPDKKLSLEGHALFPDADVAVKLSLEKSGLGFVRGGFEQWRRYYDDTGGYYRPFPTPAFQLGRDLHLDIGRAWFEVGLTRPHGPQIVLGYEYQYKDGSKSTLEWGSVNGKNIFPASEEIHDHTHILKFDLSHEFNGWRLEDSARVEINNSQTRHDDATSYTLGPAPDVVVHTGQGASNVQGMNTVRLERQVTDWWFLSGGYYYSRFDGDFTLNQTTTDGMGAPSAGTFWSSDQIELSREAHMFSVSSMLLPLETLSLSLGFQGEWQRQEALGNIHLDEGDPNLPAFFLLQPAVVQSGLDDARTTENVDVRYSKIPFTILFAEGRFAQDYLSQFEQESGNVSSAFLRDTDASNGSRDARVGFNTCPWSWVALNAHYRNRWSDTDYDHLRRFVLAGGGYSAFIRQRRIDDDEVQAKLSLRPANWLKLALRWQRLATDYSTATDPVIGGISPGGTIFAGRYDAHVYGVSATVTPFQRLYFSSALTYSDSTITSAQHGSASVAPYQGDIYTFMGSVTYALNKATDLRATYSFSQSDYAQNNVVDGLPLGLNFTRHGLTVGVARKLSERLTTNLQYSFYQYTEPNTGGFSDYTAHGIFATLVFKWP
jgi:mono/diheme cytochrome c family protein